MSHTGKNGPHLEIWVKLRKMGHTGKNGSYLEKMGVTWKNRSNLKNRFPLGKLGHT